MANILLAVDEPLFRESVAFVLRDAGHQVAEGDEVLPRFSQARPDLVIADLIMHGMDGRQLIQPLRRLDTTVRSVAISGGGALLRVDSLHVAERLGANRTLAKPFEREALLAAVDAVLSSG